METYKEKYKDLVKRLNKAREEKGVYTFNSVLDAVAPELKIEDSEDERIRKEITEFLKKASGGFLDSTIHCKTFSKWFAWLEKQDEKQSKVKYVYTKFRIGDVIVEIKPNGRCSPVRVKYIGEGAYSCESDDEKRSLYFPITNQDEYKLVEQKPADNIELSTFKDKLLELFQKFRYIKEGVPTNGDIIDYVDAHIQELIGTIQKPTWSEEDENIIRFLINVTENYRIRNGFSSVLKQGDKAIDWLKSLKNRVQPQQEWSEGDERIRQDIEILIHFALEDGSAVSPAANTTKEDAISWLKFLKDRYTWKPSDEQMKALDEARSLANNCGEEIAFDLRTLYQQLKKLREE